MKHTVLYVAYASLATPTGGGRTRIILAAKQAQKNGVSVRTLCFFPCQHLLTRFSLLKRGRIALSKEMNGSVYYAPRLPFTRLRIVSLVNDLYCGLVILLICRFFRICVVHCHGSSPSKFALLARRIGGKPAVVADIHGAVAAEYMYEKKLKEPDSQAKTLIATDHWVLSNADWLIFVSQSMKKYYEHLFDLPFDRSTIIPCLSDGTIPDRSFTRDKLRQMKNLDGKFVCCYVGSSETYQLPDQMCRVFNRILEINPNSYFMVISHHVEVFERYLEDAGIDRRHFEITSLDHSAVFGALTMADLGFLLRDESIVNRVASPTKFGEYCLAGVPVLTTSWVGDISDIVKDNGLGQIIDLEEPDAGGNLARFVNDVERSRDRYAKRCEKYILENYSWNSFGPALKNIYTEMLDRSTVGKRSDRLIL